MGFLSEQYKGIIDIPSVGNGLETIRKIITYPKAISFKNMHLNFKNGKPLLFIFETAFMTA